MSTTLPSKHYLNLIQRFPLVPIRSDLQVETATQIVRELSHPKKLKSLTNGERDYLAVLSDLLRQYTQTQFKKTEHVSAADALAFIMEENQLTQNDLAQIAGTYQSNISAFLSDKRSLSKQAALKLADHFHLSPDFFMDR